MSGSDSQVRVWDWPLRLFHWLLVIAIAVAFLSSEEGSALNRWHVLSGWVAGLLIVFRLIWGFVGGEHSRFSDFIRPSGLLNHLRDLGRGRVEPSLGHNPLGAVAVVLLLGLAAVTVLTGAFGGEAAEDIHELIGWTLLAMILVHIVAVIGMSLLQRENLIRAMITGTKARSRHPSAADARSPGIVGAGLTILVVSGALYAILKYDPHAFTLRSSSAFEQHSEQRANAPGTPDREGDD